MWKEEPNQLKKSFEFRTFVDAFAFMTKAASLAPHIHHKSYFHGNVHLVTIWLKPCEAGATVGKAEYELADEIDSVYLRMKKLG
jgi:pterin-4a-carbinolamine dehydratase